MASSSTRKGVRLTLPGASDAEYQIPGLPVFVKAHTVTPADTETIERAQQLIDQGAPLEIVDVDAEPWKGYGDKTAEQIVKRLETADTDLATTVAAYEQANKNRSTVLDAAAARISSQEA